MTLTKPNLMDYCPWQFLVSLRLRTYWPSNEMADHEMKGWILECGSLIWCVCCQYMLMKMLEKGIAKDTLKIPCNLLKQFLGRSSVWCFPKRHLQTFTHNVKGKMKKGKSSRNGSFVTLKLISLEAELGLVSSAQIRLYSSLFPLLLYFIVLTPSPPPRTHPPKKKKQSSTMLGDCDAMEI